MVVDRVGVFNSTMMMPAVLVLAAVLVVVDGSAFEKGDKGPLPCEKIKIGHTSPKAGTAVTCTEGADVKAASGANMPLWADRATR